MKTANVASPLRNTLSLSQQSISAQAQTGFVPTVCLQVKLTDGLQEEMIASALSGALVNYPMLLTSDKEEITPLPLITISGFIENQGSAAVHNKRLVISDKLVALLHTSSREQQTITLIANALFADTTVLQQLFTDAFNTCYGRKAAPRDAVSFADYIYWQDTLIDENAAAIKFWKSFDHHEKSTLAFHLVNTNPPERNTYEQEELVYSKDYIEKIMAFCREKQCAFETPLLLCYLLLLKYLSSGEGILIGLYSTERYNEELLNIAGPLSRMLPLFFSSENCNEVNTLIQKLESLQNDTTSWSEYCPADIVSPDLGFEMNDFSAVTSTAWEFCQGISLLTSFRMLLNCSRKKDELNIAIIYATGFFDREYVSIIKEQYQTLLDNVILNGITAIKPGSLYKPKPVQEFEHHYKLQMSQEVPEVNKTIIALFEEQAAKWPDKTAISFGGVNISYGELNSRANRLAYALKSHYHMQKGNITGVVLERSPGQIISFLAAMKAGTAYLPIDPSQPVTRQESIIRDAGAKILILNSADYLKGSYSFFEGSCFVIDIQEASLDPFSDNPETSPGLEDTAYLIYTSGSTGTPKGVEIGHYSLSNYTSWFLKEFGISSNDSTIIFSSLCYDLSYSALWPALSGGCNIYLEAEDAAHKPEYLLNKMVKEKVTFAKMTPSHFNMLLNSLDFAAVVHDNHLRQILLGGEPINAHDVQRWLFHSPGTNITNHYGPTETTIGVAIKNISGYSLEKFSRQPVIGRPIAGNQILLLDEEGVLVPPGIKGELAIAGPGLAIGYYHNQDMCDRYFRPHPFEPGKRIYYTGDVGVWTLTGDIVFLGRKDNQLKIRGFRIEPGEIERQVLAFPGIDSAKVIMLDGSLLAVIKTGPETIRMPALIEHLKQYLPSYMLPQQYLLQPFIPVNANGKIDLDRIRKALDGQQQSDLGYEAPRNKEEECLVAIFQEVLRKNGIGITDDFFRLGGDSLRAVQVLTLLYQRMQLKAEVRLIFDYPTIKELAVNLHFARTSAYKEIQALDEREYYPLSHEQKRLWILNQYESRNISYNRPASYTLEGSLNVQALENAFNALIVRHESLRTIYNLVDGVPMQHIIPHAQYEMQMDHHDLSGHIHPTQDARDLCNSLALAPFDLMRGPLIRIALFKLGPEQHVLSIVMHHIVSDAWSVSVFTNELFLLYNSYCTHTEIPLSKLRIQYKDYACWQSEQIESDIENAHRHYWGEVFRDGAPILHLPEDISRPAYRSYRGKREVKLLSQDINLLLQEVANEQGISLYMLLLTLINVQLFKYSGQTDIVIGSPVAGRDHPDLQGQIGIYLNTLPVRIRFASTDTLQQLLISVRDQVLNAFEHRIYPFDLLLEDLQLSWDTSRSPLFDVALVLQNVEVSQENTAEGMNDIRITDFDMDFNTCAIDLRIEFTAYDNCLGMVVDYNTDVFTANRIQRFIHHFETLAAGLRAGMTEPLSKISCLPAIEKDHLLTNFDTLSVTNTRSDLLDELFRKTVKQYPDNIALVYNDQQLTYRELDQQADKLAHYLADICQVLPGDYVCVHIEKSTFYIIAILAVLRSGGIYVPIDPEHPSERKKHIISDTGATVLLTSSAYLFDFSYFGGHMMAVDLQLDTIALPPQSLPVLSNADAIAYVIYTSGSTGIPKGVLIRHESILKRVLYCNNYLGITDNDCILQFAAQGFDASLYEIFMALIPGGRLVITDELSRKSIPAFLTLLEREKVTVATLPPAFLKIIDKERMPGIRILVSTGEAALIEDAVYYAGFKDYYNGYGPTEACIGASFYKVQPLMEQRYQQRNGIPIGTPFADTAIYVLDKDMNLAGIANPGEIYIASSCLAAGYLNDADLTASKFLINPFRANDGYERIYRTGDTGRWSEDGLLEYMGRADDQVQINGIRVEPNEVNTHLLKHPSVSVSAVVYLEGRGLVACMEKKKRFSLWPDVNIVNLFDDLLYHAMGKDNARLSAYSKSFAKYLPGKTVLDVGTGKDALLARLAVANGASKVYAVEMNETACQQVAQLIEKEHLQDKIILVKGDIRNVNLPEQVDFMIHDLSGNIGGAAGASVIINSAKRFLKHKENIIPQSYLTHASAYCLDPEKFDFSFEAIPAGYISKIFEQTGYPFDLRLCLNEVEEKNILSGRAAFETINFERTQPENCRTELELEVNRDGLFTGLVLGLNVTVEEGLVVDNMLDGNTILPVYIPIFHPGIAVRQGDIIRLSVTRELAENGLNPDFYIEGSLSCVNGQEHAFEHYSYNHANHFRQTSFYQELFSQQGQMTIRPEFSPEAVRNYLRQKLPVYMVPQKIIVFEQLPHNINGKIDIKKIAAELELGLEVEHIMPATELEQTLANIWMTCLETDRIGINDNFFERGANSLRVIRALKLLDEAFPRSFEISDIFSYPTIAGLRDLLTQQRVGSKVDEVEELEL